MKTEFNLPLVEFFKILKRMRKEFGDNYNINSDEAMKEVSKLVEAYRKSMEKKNAS